jgi:1-phosphofructokinase family hexose kinase
MIVCVAANPSIDKLFVVDRVTTGAIHRPRSFVQVAGGKGLNVARAAVALGADVEAVGLLGGHSGAWIAEALGSDGIPGYFAWTDAETRSCLSVADAEGSLTEFYESGSELGQRAWDDLRAVVESRLDSARWLILSGSLPRGIPPNGYADLIESARRKEVAVALDTRDESLALALPAGPDIVKINASEAGDLLGLPVTNLEQAAAAASELRIRAGGKGAAVLTRGADGAVAAFADELWRGSSDVRGPYPVGSGDAFLAGLITALDRREGPKRAFALALGAGAANAEEAGAGRLQRERAESIAGGAEIVQLDQPAEQ